MRQDLIWRLQAAGFAGFIGFMRLLGVERASALGGWLLRTLGPKAGTQKTVMRNLRIAFPDMAPAEREALALAQWEQTGRAFAETALMDRLVAEGRIEVVGRERLEAIRESGRPVVFVGGHFANIETLAATIVGAGVPCQITYRAANNPYVDAQIIAARARYGVKLFAPKGGDGARELLAGMARGESVALMNDQKFSEGPEVTFFGQPVNAAPGPSRLALRFGTVLQPMSVVRLPGVRFRVTLYAPIELEKTGDRPADIARGVQAITSFIEARVRENPVDWFWVHRRWPDRVYAALNAE
ncbi:MAG: lipid A biosynthesis acyltransferase [Brevundimonas sp.]|uniref:lysophospholipid acyltransferase family protein n=1 Tax=Brevundimonas sp. TaxID=1871086 RepID=UPI0026094509|nr:lipid A biosynthesis acyltransferase [Brevundimonas sp.]MDI6625824.1 lipid A biosynthesis acyltransferase [Brevundimonas sp.]MDQ7813251.1 lipid A biosynthesis acyltransferase [Brevundimonas sp.]